MLAEKRKSVPTTSSNAISGREHTGGYNDAKMFWCMLGSDMWWVGPFGTHGSMSTGGKRFCKIFSKVAAELGVQTDGE